MSPELQRLRARDPSVLPVSGALVTDPEADIIADALASTDLRAQMAALAWCDARHRCHRRARVQP